METQRRSQSTALYTILNLTHLKKKLFCSFFKSVEKVTNNGSLENVKTNTMIFSLKNQPGGLAKALKVLQVNYFSKYNI